jgi:hypothetical protein
LDPLRWKRIQDIFYEASELEPSVRAAYLDQTCAGDEPLRAEVDGFLRSLENGVDDRLAHAIGAEAASLLDPDANPGEGRMVGAYRLVRKIGQGGMGAVYLAERADRQFDRQVAIKLAPADMAGSAGRLLRFRMERQILANLDHPNIASMLDGGITEDGLPFLVMEYVEGRPIDEYCGANALSIRERIALFVTVCAAVRYAHHNLVIHRDIKPSNILVTEAGVPKLLDFGIAKLMAPGAAGLTLPAERLMTLEYAAPEQMLGLPVTTATDVYALGIVLWELLTSRRLFEHARASAEPPPPSSIAEAPAGAREIRGDLDNIVSMALRKEPAARYGSVEQLEDDLRRYLEGFPVFASRGSGTYKALKFVRRHGAAVAAAAAAVVMLVGFAIAMSALAARASRERDAAREQRARAEQISQFLTSLFASSDPFHVSANAITAKDLLDHGARRIASDLAGQPRVQASLLETMAVAYQHLGLHAEAEDLFRQQARAEERGSGPQSIGVARAAAAWRRGARTHPPGGCRERSAAGARHRATDPRRRDGAGPHGQRSRARASVAGPAGRGAQAVRASGLGFEPPSRRDRRDSGNDEQPGQRSRRIGRLRWRRKGFARGVGAAQTASGAGAPPSVAEHAAAG